MAPVELPGPLVDFFNVAPVITAFLLFLSPARTIYNLYREGGHNNVIPVLPYVLMVAQSVTWMLYGLLIESVPVWIPNLVGVSCGAVYTMVYHYFSHKRMALIPSYVVGILWILMVTLLYLLQDPEAATLQIGILACTAGVLFVASPLITLYEVIKTKSVESMPLDLSLVVFINATLWVLFGFLMKDDIFIWLPNLLAAILSSIQLMCHLIYPNTRSLAKINDSSTKVMNESDLEINLCPQNVEKPKEVSTTESSAIILA